MGIFSFVYTEILFRPLFNLLVLITKVLPTHNIGWAIIIVTLIVRLVLFYPSWQQAKQASRNQEKMKGVQEKIAAVKEKHKEDQAQLSRETMKIYREAGINPAAGCLPLIIQLPILIALYRVFLVGLGPDTYNNLYSAVTAPQAISNTFFGLVLAQPSLLLAVLAGLGQFWLMGSTTQAANTSSGSDEAAQMMASMQKNMKYFFPVMTVFIALRLPAALSLYWVASTLLALVQQRVVKKWLKTDTVLPAM